MSPQARMAKGEPGHPDAWHRDGLITPESTRLTVPVSFVFDSALARINEDSPHGSGETVG
jgi:hypothetical protein